MDQYKVNESKRRLVTTYLGIWGFGSRPILSTPGLVINEKLVCAGRIPNEAEVTTWLINAEMETA